MTVPNGRAQSVLAKLTALHHQTGKPHQYLIDRFAQERFLYRLSTGTHSDRFVLKGGLLITAITDRFYRATRDIDVRAFASNDPTAMKLFMTEALAHDVVDDGMAFNTSAMDVQAIRTQGEERGLRLRMPATLGRARANLQIDVGFGDVILLPSDAFVYPVLLAEYPTPILRAYSVESIIAEKVEAIASLDWQTTRYKDFDDVLELASSRKFNASSLWLAITLTFERRGTSLNRVLPSLGADRATAKRENEYRAYRRREDVRRDQATFAQQLERLRHFIEPLLRYDADGLTRVWEHEQWQVK